MLHFSTFVTRFVCSIHTWKGATAISESMRALVEIGFVRKTVNMFLCVCVTLKSSHQIAAIQKLREKKCYKHHFPKLQTKIKTEPIEIRDRQLLLKRGHLEQKKRIYKINKLFNKTLRIAF